MTEYLKTGDNLDLRRQQLSQTDMSKVWQIKQMYDQIFKHKNTKDANANRRKFDFKYLKPRNKEKLYEKNN